MNRILVCSLLMVLTACIDKSASVNQTELNEQVRSMEERLSTVESGLVQVQGDLRFEKLIRNVNKIAFLKVGESEFLPIETYLGTITFNVEDIQPFANGSKVILVIGNPLNASLGKASFHVDYGTLDGQGEILEGTEKSKQVTVPNDINRGSWNKVPVVLDGLEASKLGYIRIHDFEASQIILTKR